MRIAQLTDLHATCTGQLAYDQVDTIGFLERAIARLNTLQKYIDAVVISGDLVDHGTLEEYATLRPMLDQLNMPWWPIPGNHDSELFWSVFADRLPNAEAQIGYVVEHAAVRFIMLDTRVEGFSHGELNEQRLHWLAQVLPGTVPALLVMHHPPFATGIAHMDRIGLKGIDQLRALLVDHPPIAVLCGHIHRTIVSSLGDVPVIVAPSPAHAVAFDLSDDGPSNFELEPPGFMLHTCNSHSRTMVSHTVFINDFPGPWPFF